MTAALPYYDAEAVMAVGYAGAVEAIVSALRGGLDPAAGVPRTGVDLANGLLLLMPAEDATSTGIKLVTVAPGNVERGVPTVLATYLLLDRTTLAPVAVLDGTALTTLRTPAVSVAAMLHRLPERPLRLAVIGHGPQAQGHAAAFGAVRPLERVTYLVRDPARSPVPATALGTDDARGALRAADVIVCATSSRTPVLHSDDVSDDAVVVAVGAYEPDARELDGALVARSTVVVEDLATALRENGDVVLAIAEGSLAERDVLAMRDVVAGAVEPDAGRPLMFTGVGMAWQDLVVARAVVAAEL